MAIEAEQIVGPVVTIVGRRTISSRLGGCETVTRNQGDGAISARRFDGFLHRSFGLVERVARAIRRLTQHGITWSCEAALPNGLTFCCIRSSGLRRRTDAESVVFWWGHVATPGCRHNTI